MDKAFLLALKALRMAAYGLTTMVLVPFLLALGCSEQEVGLFMTLTLFGDVVLSAIVTRHADNLGRRFMLGLSSILMLLSGVSFMFCTNFYVLLVAAVFGVISPSGDEVGPFRAIEESAIAEISSAAARVALFASQTLVGTLGLAVGALAGGFLADAFTEKTGKAVDAYRVVFFGYTMLALASFVVCAQLSDGVELPRQRIALEAETEAAAWASELQNEQFEGTGAESGVSEPVPQHEPVAERTQEVTVSPNEYKLLAFFAVDSLAYGFMPNSWLVEYLKRNFHSANTVLGAFFFVSTFISAMTSYPSAWFTNKVGSVVAISFTKLGAGLFGGLVPVAKDVEDAMAFVWLRSLFDTMDVVPRQVFLASVIPNTERTRVFGLINIVKTFARSIGPVFTGYLAERGHLAWCFVIMGLLEWTFAIAVFCEYYKESDRSGAIQI